MVATDGAVLIRWRCMGSGGDRGIEKSFDVIVRTGCTVGYNCGNTSKRRTKKMTLQAEGIYKLSGWPLKTVNINETTRY